MLAAMALASWNSPFCSGTAANTAADEAALVFHTGGMLYTLCCSHF